MARIIRAFAMLILLVSLSSCRTEYEKRRDDVELHETKLLLSFGTSGAAYSPDGQFLAVGNWEKIWVVNTQSGKVVNTIRADRYGKFGNQKGLLFIDQNRLLVGLEGGVLLFNLATNDKEGKISFPGSGFAPRAMAWSPATQAFAYSSGGSLNSVSITTINDGGFGAVNNFPGFQGVPADLLFSDDGFLLAAAGDESGVKIREVSTGSLAGELPTKGYVNELARYGENRMLVAGADLEAWAFYTESEFKALDNADMQGQIDGQVAARIGGTAALTVLWAVTIAFALFGAGLAAMSGADAPSGGGGGLEGEIYRVATTPIVTSLAQRCGRSTAISLDGRMLVDVSPGITKEVIRVVDPESGEKLRGLNPPGDYTCNVKFSPDGRQLLITTNEVVRIYDTDSWKYQQLSLK